MLSLPDVSSIEEKFHKVLNCMNLTVLEFSTLYDFIKVLYNICLKKLQLLRSQERKNKYINKLLVLKFGPGWGILLKWTKTQSNPTSPVSIRDKIPASLYLWLKIAVAWTITTPEQQSFCFANNGGKALFSVPPSIHNNDNYSPM